MGSAQTGWRLMVGGYRFYVSLEQAPRAFWNLQAQALPHAPAWMAGLALIEGHAAGVLDLGRFMGLSRATPGPWLQPEARLGRAWVLQVHELMPVVGSVSFTRFVPSQASGTSDAMQASPPQDRSIPRAAGTGVIPPASGLVDRVRPGFSCESASWLEADAQTMQADVLNLEALLEHPRIREFQS